MKFKLDRKGVRNLLLSDEMQSGIQNVAAEIQSRCGDGYGTDVQRGKNRHVAFVRTETEEAKLDNEINNTLLKATH